MTALYVEGHWACLLLVVAVASLTSVWEPDVPLLRICSKFHEGGALLRQECWIVVARRLGVILRPTSSARVHFKERSPGVDITP
ncbi:hypothetical protein BDZ85DRAFT_266271 [Elsinoe ampelina]|uniref:Secreted protein n=1 Tax=Elsinoe ampelina TaxID=302913 RepID=A0A6A6G5P9_9PEZI|nr:hypothetical protein BDZ85DRAFT_266271 [Elsinoe ampelina]